MPPGCGTSLFNYLLAQVVLDIGREVAFRIRLYIHRGELAVDQRPRQREVGAGLERRQRVEPMGVRPAAEQIDAAAAQTARARSCEDETGSRLLDQPVYFVEYEGRTLHLVEHHPPVMAGGNQVPQSLRLCQQLQIQRMIEQIQVDCIREPLLQPRGLAGAPGPEQEEALAALVRDIHDSGIHTPILSRQKGNYTPVFVDCFARRACITV